MKFINWIRFLDKLVKSFGKPRFLAICMIWSASAIDMVLFLTAELNTNSKFFNVFILLNIVSYIILFISETQFWYISILVLGAAWNLFCCSARIYCFCWFMLDLDLFGWFNGLIELLICCLIIESPLRWGLGLSGRISTSKTSLENENVQLVNFFFCLTNLVYGCNFTWLLDKSMEMDFLLFAYRPFLASSGFCLL